MEEYDELKRELSKNNVDNNKIDLKKINTFTQDIRKKVGNEVKIYFLKLKHPINIFVYSGTTFFVFIVNLKNSQFIENLKFTKGLKYFLRGHD